MRILFDSKLSQFKTPFGVLKPGEVCTLHIQIPVSCRTEHVELLLFQEDGTPAREVSLSRQETGALYECFGAAFSLERAGLYFYCFRVTTKNEQFRLYKQGNDTNMEAGDFWQLSCVEDAYPVPEALRGAVMYQIFPDRFYQSGCCNCAEKLQPYWVHEDKSDVPVYLPDEHGEVLNNDFYGGNLNGICEKLPYLQELGVEILYLNPIFMAFSTHRYDTYDYKRIDPMLGTEADFSALCSRAHALGMKVVLDGVFSHVGSRSPYFQSAISNPDSPYRDWFQFKHYPDVYESWWGITTLPCVDKMNESYIRYIIEDEDSVLAHWLRLGADGYRLDVVDELPDAFLTRLRKRLRELKPDAILIGEVWEDASNKVAYGVRRRYLTGRQLDSVMNYPWQGDLALCPRRGRRRAAWRADHDHRGELPARCPERRHEHPFHARHAARTHRAGRSDRRRPRRACQTAYGRAHAQPRAAPAADGGVFTVHAAGCAVHLLWRRGGHGRLPRPVQPEILPVGRGG